MACEHEWEKIEKTNDYYDYCGFHVAVILCKCNKCGRKEEKKFLYDKQPGEIFKDIKL